MRAWFRWGLIVCCAAGAGRSWAQGCTEIDAVDRTAMELRCSQQRAPSLLAYDGPDGRSFDLGGIAVLEDDGVGGLIYQTKAGDTTIDIPAISQRFYRSHRDDFDFLALFTCFPIVDPATALPF